MRELRAGELFNLHEEEMIAGELAHCRHLHLAGIGLGVLNEILKRLIRAVFGNHDHVGVVNEAAKRAELFRFVARLPFGA